MLEALSASWEPTIVEAPLIVAWNLSEPARGPKVYLDQSTLHPEGQQEPALSFHRVERDTLPLATPEELAGEKGLVEGG